MPGVAGAVIANAAKHPHFVAADIQPERGIDSPARLIAGSGDTLRAVDAHGVGGGGAGYPRPLLGAGVKPPDIVEKGVALRGIAVAAKQPDLATGVDPTDSAIARGRQICGSGYALGAENRSGIGEVGAAHPGP